MTATAAPTGGGIGQRSNGSSKRIDGGIPPEIRRNMAFIAVAQALVGAGGQLTPSLGAIIIQRLLGSYTFVGVATGLNGLSRMLIAYPIGSLTDSYGRRAGMVVSLLVAMVGAVLTGLSVGLSSFPLFVGSMFVFGCGMGGVQQLRVAATDMFPPSRRAEGVGILLTGSAVGAFGGVGLVSLANALGDQWLVDPVALAWLIAPAGFLPALLLVLLVHPDPKEIAANLSRYYPSYTRPAAPAFTLPIQKASLRAYAGDYPKLTTFACSFFVQGNMNMMMALTALVLDHHGHGLPAISLGVAIHVVGMFGLSLPLGKAADRFGRRPVLLGGVLVAGVASVVVVSTSAYWLIVLGTFLVGVGWSGVNVGGTALLADTTRAGERGRVIGANDTFASLAQVSLPLLGGAMAEGFGLQSVGVAALVLSLVPALLLLRLKEPWPGSFPQSRHPH